VLGSCGDDSGRKQQADQEAAELALMRDAAKAGPQIEERLRKRMRSDGQILLIKEEFGTLHATPATVSWTLTCGAGLGLSIAAAGESTGIYLAISDSFLEEKDCLKLLPLTAAKVSDILAAK
jgi:hypothetical protein